jgi:hypothetical protein
MTIFSEFGLRERSHPLLNAQCFALEHLICIHATTSDLRWAMLELVLRSFTAMCVLAQGQLALLACRIRHGKRRLADRLDAADGGSRGALGSGHVLRIGRPA